MNINLLKAVSDSGIQQEIIAVVQAISADRTVATPPVLVAFTGYVEPTTTPTNTVRNTAILAMLAHYPLNTNSF